MTSSEQTGCLQWSLLLRAINTCLCFASLYQDTGDGQQVPFHDSLISKPGTLGMPPFTRDSWNAAGFLSQPATPQPPPAPRQ